MNKSGVQLIVLILIALLSMSVFADKGLATERPRAKPSSQPNAGKDRKNPSAQTRGNRTSASKANGKSDAQQQAIPENDSEGHQPPESEMRKEIPEQDHSKINEQLAATIKVSDPIGYLNDTKALVALAVLIFLALGLHAVQVFLQMHTRQRVLGLQRAIQRLSTPKLNTETWPSKGNAPVNRTEQSDQQNQDYQQISAQIKQVDNCLAESSRQMAETFEALKVTVLWIGQSQLNKIVDQAGDQTSEVDRIQMIRILGQYKDVFSLNAERVSSLSEALMSFVENAKTRPYLPAELTSRAQALYQGIQQIHHRNADLNERLSSLQRGSLAERLSMLKSQQEKLAKQFNSGNISIADYVRGYQQSFDHHFPKDVEDSPLKLSPIEYEGELKSMTTSMSDYLMNWFDDLFQLQSQVAAAQASISQVDASTVAELAQIQKIARDVLGKFDIQPEEIQIGQTFFDRRLHDAELIAQSAQFPANTVIGVNQCGFRKASTGEALRRPKVIVAGVGAV